MSLAFCVTAGWLLLVASMVIVNEVYQSVAAKRERSFEKHTDQALELCDPFDKTDSHWLMQQSIHDKLLGT